MRSIGELNSAELATRFCDYLLTIGIEATGDPSSDDPEAPYDIWVRDEERLDDARIELQNFNHEPNHARYASAGQKANQLRAQEHAENQRRLKLQTRVLYKGPRDIGGGSGNLSSTPVTVAIIALCVLATLFTNMGNPKVQEDADGVQTHTFQSQLFDSLSFVSYKDYVLSNRDPMASIRKGQVWRLVSPMFIHLGVIHLLFNMLWMFRLGGAIEQIQSSLFLLGLILVCEIVAGLVQALMPDFLGGNPFGYGASGAVYGIFGYLWIRPKFDSAYPFQLSTNTIYLMIGWLFLCMTGLLGGIGNGAHVGGLLAGMAMAPIVCKLTRK